MSVLRGWACALVALGAFAPAGACAGAWPENPGEAQLIVTTTYDWATRGFDAHGRAREAVRYDKREVSVFGEFGLTSRITLVGRGAWQDVTIDNAGMVDAQRGLGATDLGARITVRRTDWDVISAQATVIVPGDVENVSDLRLGEGGRDYEARLLYGRSFRAWNGDGFAEAQAGWRWRTGAPPDEARLDLTLGWRKGRWLGIAQVLALHASGATPPRRDYDNVKLGASVVRELSDDSGVQIGAFHAVWGRRIVQETAVFAGLWRRF